MKESNLHISVDTRRTLGGIPVQGFSEDFAYDPIGNRVSATDYDESGTPRTSIYAANSLNQYVSRTVPGWASVRGLAATNAYISVNGNEAFTMAGRVVPNAPKYYFGSDDFDNSMQSGWAELETYASVPSATNGPDLVSTVTNRVFVPQTPETLAYDADGNMIEDGRFRYWWNGENRMVRAEEKMPPEGRVAHVVTYSYDHQGRNVAKDGSLQIWDAYNIVVENAAASNVVINAWGLDIDGSMQGAGGVGGLLVVVRSGATSLPLYDANGNITEYMDSQGGVVAHTDYSAFGRGLMRNGVQSYSHGFSTKPWCRKSGLVEYQMRKYMPWHGRWMSVDPTYDKGGFNLYGYVNNESISRIDYGGTSPSSSMPLILIQEGINGMSAMGKLLKGYVDMRRANVRGADKWFHCVSMCEAAKDSLGVTAFIAVMREVSDLSLWIVKQGLGVTDKSNDNFTKQLLDSLDDMAVNEVGMSCPSSQSCEDRCRDYKVKGL